MELAEVYVALGQDRTVQLARTISMGALRRFGVYEGIKIRSRLKKFNRQRLRAAAPTLWRRIASGDTGLARELSQAVLVSNTPLIVEVLDLLEIEHDENGFFDRDFDYSAQLTSDWADKAFEAFRTRYPEELVLLYINHLGWETDSLDRPFLGSDAGVLAARAQ